MAFYTTIQDFTGVYNEQPFMQELRDYCSSSTPKDCTAIHWMDCTQINGTDCYCDDEAQLTLNRMMDQATSKCNKDCTELAGIHFFDNGNYHYMSKLWTDRITEDFDLVIFDHHPDMQPPRFEGILSCGGWIKEVLDHNPHIKKAFLIGVANHLIEEIKNEPSAEFESYKDRVALVPENIVIRENGVKIANTLPLTSPNVYISIDKDVLSLNEVVTNWDQGSLTFSQLEEILKSLFRTKKILGIDICGERARNQEFAEGFDEESADTKNNQFNINLFKTLQNLFQNRF